MKRRLEQREVEGRMRLRERRQSRRRRFIIAVTVLTLLLVAGIVAAFWWRGVRIGSVHIAPDTNSSLSDAQRTTALTAAHSYLSKRCFFIFPCDQVLWYSRGGLAAAVANALPEVSSATTHTTSLTTAEVSITTRVPFALWQNATTSTDYFYIDASGVVFARPSTELTLTASSTMVRYSGNTMALSDQELPTQYLTPSTFVGLSKSVTALNAVLVNQNIGPIAEVSVDATGSVRATTHSGFALFFPLSDTGGAVEQRLAAAFASDAFATSTVATASYVDLRYGDRVYFKQNKEEKETKVVEEKTVEEVQ